MHCSRRRTKYPNQAPVGILSLAGDIIRNTHKKLCAMSQKFVDKIKILDNVLKNNV
jgi:hypothetical protein